MVERPTIFSAHEVRAILAGTQTQTRRLMRDHDRLETFEGKPYALHGRHCTSFCEYACGATFFDKVTGQATDHRGRSTLRTPFGGPGDRLWVRETWGLHRHTDITDWHQGTVRGSSFDDVAAQWAIAYAADSPNGDHWRPSIHMPRWASRITLEVTGVRVERLQDITEEDARAEGFPLGWVPTRITVTGLDGKKKTSIGTSIDSTARGGFCHAWDAINGKRALWVSNPWVWVVVFRRVT